MTEPIVEPTKLDEAREKLHAALLETMAAVGWAARADALPPRSIVSPWGWVDAPTLSNQAQAEVPAGALAATFPVVITTDGLTREQVALLDRLLAHGWDKLSAVQLGTGTRARVISAGPQFLELPSGQETRAVVFSVQITLQARTLCSGTVTASNDSGAPAAP